MCAAEWVLISAVPAISTIIQFSLNNSVTALGKVTRGQFKAEPDVAGLGVRDAAIISRTLRLGGSLLNQL